MRPKDLRFVCELEGKKPQLVFEQDETYFVMTTMDNDERGNFFAVSNWDTEQVLREADKLGSELFHPRELNLFKHKEASYRESRIRAICYALVAQKQMMLEKVGREIQFRTWREYGYSRKQSSPSKTTPAAKPAPPPRNTFGRRSMTTIGRNGASRNPRGPRGEGRSRYIRFARNVGPKLVRENGNGTIRYVVQS
jgi:hypothetical protein